MWVDTFLAYFERSLHWLLIFESSQPCQIGKWARSVCNTDDGVLRPDKFLLLFWHKILVLNPLEVWIQMAEQTSEVYPGGHASAQPIYKAGAS